MPVREPFNPDRPLIAARDFRFGGIDYKAGDAFPYSAERKRLISRQYEVRAIDHAPAEQIEEPEDAGPKMAKGPKNGYYTLSAPWLDEPVVVRGKVNAEKAFTDLQQEGPPEGWNANPDKSDGDEDDASQEGAGENLNKLESETGAGEGEGPSGDPVPPQNGEGAGSAGNGDDQANA